MKNTTHFTDAQLATFPNFVQVLLCKNLTFRFVTNEYHGTPKGRGSYAFVATVGYEGGYETLCDPDDVLFSPSMTYTDAKKWAKTAATELVAKLADQNPDVVFTGEVVLSVQP